MSSYLSEYLTKRMGILQMESELQKLIGEYNKNTGHMLFVFASDINKGKTRGVDVSLGQEDFYNIQDILHGVNQPVIDVYLETPGGSGEAAEEIAKFLRKNFSVVNFIIAGEAKSAGTILALSGDDIFMTETGSLGPIDAQVKIGRSFVSAHDYLEWVDEMRKEASTSGKLNPFDAIMVAQISPGELKGVFNSLEFAKDIVSEWLELYKFKNWDVTETRGLAVTTEMKQERAKEVAKELSNHTTWRTHGRSLKIEDLSHWLQIQSIDRNKGLAEIVYRIKTIIRLIFDGSTHYKLYYLDNLKLSKNVMGQPLGGSTLPFMLPPVQGQQKRLSSVDFNIICQKCGKSHAIRGYFSKTSDEIKKNSWPVNQNIKDNDVLVCDNCNYAIDLKPIKAQIESKEKLAVTFK